jgi:hypothetical protein
LISTGCSAAASAPLTSRDLDRRMEKYQWSRAATRGKK